ncbi:MAG: hypothetical protein AAF628_10050 [Planctomycetota bacterium]
MPIHSTCPHDGLENVLYRLVRRVIVQRHTPPAAPSPPSLAEITGEISRRLQPMDVSHLEPLIAKTVREALVDHQRR